MSHLNLSKALIVDGDRSNRVVLKSLLENQGYKTIEASNGRQAIDLFQAEQPSIIFMDIVLPEVDGYEATREIKLLSGNHFVPIIFLTSMRDEASLSRCIEAGGDDFLVRPFDNFMLKSKIHAIERISALNQKIQGMYSMVNREQEIAESVFTKAIQGTNISNPLIKSKIRPAGTFSGDMILSAYSPSRDLFILIGDFTGHGLSAAIGAMPVSEVFHAMTSKGFSPEDILIGINKKLRTLLPIGMFFGVQLVAINPELEHIKLFNAGMPDLLIVDGKNNSIKHRAKSGGLPLGIIDDIKPREFRDLIPIEINDRVLMFSDGLTEARSASDEEFGDVRLQNSIKNATDDNIYGQIFADLDDFCGDMTQADDVTLVEITCATQLIPLVDTYGNKPETRKSKKNSGEWQLTIKYSGARLRETNPVPILVNQIMEMEELENQRQSLFTVITELYVNALDHGVLSLDSSMKADPIGFARYFSEREARLSALDSGHIIFDLSVAQIDKDRCITFRIEDSGDGFNYETYRPSVEATTMLSGRGILLVKDLCDSLNYEGRGNIVKAVFNLNHS